MGLYRVLSLGPYGYRVYGYYSFSVVPIALPATPMLVCRLYQSVCVVVFVYRQRYHFLDVPTISLPFLTYTYHPPLSTHHQRRQAVQVSGHIYHQFPQIKLQSIPTNYMVLTSRIFVSFRHFLCIWVPKPSHRVPWVSLPHSGFIVIFLVL